MGFTKRALDLLINRLFKAYNQRLSIRCEKQQR